MATDDTTKLVVSLELILRNLDKTLKGLSQVEKQLRTVASIKIGAGNTSTANLDKAAAAATRLQIQQQKLAVQLQNVTNAQTRADLATQRLAVSQQRLAAAQQRVTQSAGQQADAHVRAFKAIQRGIDSADKHVQFFRAHEEALRKAPPVDAHVQAFRAIEERAKQTNASIQSLGNAFRSIGQGASTIGIALSAALTVPLVAIGKAGLDAAVSMDSLKRGLTAITGSSAEAGKQLTRLQEIAKLPGIGFEEAIQGSIRLQAVGFSAAEAEKSLVQFANAIALTGGGRAELERVTIQLGQLAAKGKVLSQDLRPIIEAAPAVGRALLQAFGTVNADDIQELGLSSKEFLATLTSQLEKLPRAAAGAKNSFENFRDTVFRASAAIGDALLPTLTKLIDTFGPIITKLAEGFNSLPNGIKTLITVLAALAAATGPLLFVFGQLGTGIGRIVVGIAQLNALGGIGTLVKNLRLMASGALAAAEAETTLAAANSLVTVSLIGLGAAIALAVAIYTSYKSSQKDAIQLSKDQVDAQEAVISGLEDQVKFLDSLQSGVKRTSDQEQQLADIYKSLNVQAQARVTGITDEEKRLAALRAELEKVLQLKQAERVQGAANLAGSLANTLGQIAANEKEIESNVRRVQANAALADSIRQSNTITAEQSKQLARQGINAATVEEALGALQAESENLVSTNKDLRESTDGLNGTAKEQAATLATLEQQTGLTARQLLLAAKNMGVFRGDVETTLKQLELYTDQTVKATDATRTFNDVLKEQSGDLVKAGDAAEEAEKRRKKLISSAAALAREASTTFDGALKFFRAFIAANPELGEAVRKQAQVQQKTIDEFLRETLGGQDKSGTALRNAQEQLQKAISAIVKAEGDKRVAEQEATNDILLRANETAFKQQLISYREYLQQRQRLTDTALSEEAKAQGDIIEQARANQVRLLKESQDQKLPAAERVKRGAQAKGFEAQAIEAERKLVEIQSKRRALTDDTTNALAEAAVQQREDVRKLEIEYAKLTDRIEESLNAATDEKFRVTLLGLVQTQQKLNEELRKAKEVKDADAIAGIEAAKALNQRQIDVINNTITEERALNRLTAVEEIVSRAKQDQADLEKQIAFDVEFRGLKETEAVARRLEGERKLKDALEASRNTVQQTIADLEKLGLKPPKALIDFVNQTQLAMKGLGELSFKEQFDLAAKEFSRIQDELAAKIAEVELAVRHRDLAEIQGRILIKKLNGEYVADLEKQAALLADIAAKSGNQGLQKQASDAQQTAREVRAATTETAEFNKALRSVSIDALQQGFSDFFRSLTDNTKTAQEKLLGLLDSVTSRITDFIAQNLSEKLIESIFGNPNDQAKAGGGIIAAVKRLFGFGGGDFAGTKAGGAGADIAGTLGKGTEVATAATALATAGTTAGTALTTGAVTFTSSVTTSAAAFATTVVAAGAAFAAAVAAGSAASAIGSAGSSLGSALGAAATGMFPATPGGLVRIVEGGFDEAVLTTDPQHAAQQVRILRNFLARTKGLYGRIQGFAEGGLISAHDAEMNLLASLGPRGSVIPAHAPSPQLASASGVPVNLRNINLFDKRQIAGSYIRSAEGARDILNVISENADEVGRRIPVR